MDDRAAISLYVALLYARVPATRNRLEAMVELMGAIITADTPSPDRAGCGAFLLSDAALCEVMGQPPSQTRL